MTINTLIVSRPGIGKTQKAIEYYIDKITSGVNGVYFCLEMSGIELMDRISYTCDRNNIKLSQDEIKNINISTSVRSFDDVVQYLESIDNNINFIILDYLQLFKQNREYSKLFSYCKQRQLNVILLSQLKRGIEIKDAVWTECVLALIEKDDGFLQYLNDGYFLTKTYGSIYCENISTITR